MKHGECGDIIIIYDKTLCLAYNYSHERIISIYLYHSNNIYHIIKYSAASSKYAIYKMCGAVTGVDYDRWVLKQTKLRNI